jgi:hypothetical protein
MSSPVMPKWASTGPSISTSSTSSDAGSLAAFIAELAGSDRAPTIEASEGCPPPELLEEIFAAGRIEERLRESGQHVSFLPSVPNGRTAIELHDRDGDMVRSLSIAALLELAAGKPLG